MIPTGIWIAILILVAGVSSGLAALIVYFKSEKKRLQEKKEESSSALEAVSYKSALSVANKEIQLLQEKLRVKTVEDEKELSAAKLRLEEDLNLIRAKKLQEINLSVEEYKKQMLTAAKAQFELEKHKIAEESEIIEEAHKIILKTFTNEIETAVKEQEAIIAQLMKNYEEANDEFNRIVSDEDDLFEVKELKNLAKKFRRPEVIHKVVFEEYYREKSRKLINLHTKGKRITGIYRITLRETGQSYVGQSVDIGNRWLQHIKRGVGTEPPTNTALYPAMLKHGIEAFDFEILEVTDAAKLGDREKFWTEFYKSKVFGFNMRAG